MRVEFGRHVGLCQFAESILSPCPQQSFFVLTETKSSSDLHICDVAIDHKSGLIKSSKHASSPKIQRSYFVNRCRVVIAGHLPDASQIHFFRLVRHFTGRPDSQLPKLVISECKHLAATREHLGVNQPAQNLSALDYVDLVDHVLLVLLNA